MSGVDFKTDEVVGLQANTVFYANEDLRKYTVGKVLTFRDYDQDEVATLSEHKYVFQRGDKLEVLPRNGCGMGIDMVRLRDGRTDMVWPTEVNVSQRQIRP